MTDYTLQGSQFSSMIAAFAPPPQKTFLKRYQTLWSLHFHAHHTACRHASADCWAGLCCLEKQRPGWKGWAAQTALGYGGPTGTTAQEEMPTSETAPCSFRERQKGHVNPRPPHQGLMLLHNCYSSYIWAQVNVTTKVRQIYFYTTFCLRAKIKLFREATDVIMVSFDFVLCSLGQLRNNYMKKKHNFMWTVQHMIIINLLQSFIQNKLNG